MTESNSLLHHTGIPMPRSIRGKVPINPQDARRPSILSAPPATSEGRVRNRQTHRITPLAKDFLIKCINTGYSNRQINRLLRKKFYILEEEPDLSHDALGKIRQMDECQLDIAHLTQEARQIGHNYVGKFLMGWAELGDEVLDRLLNGGDFGDSFERVTVGECTALLVKATKIVMSVFAAGLGDKLKAERDETQVAQEKDADDSAKAKYLEEYLYAVGAAALNRALREREAQMAAQNLEMDPRLKGLKIDPVSM